MTDRELMQQALDAFEYHVETAEVEDKRIEAAIYALRTVLAQPEQEPVVLMDAPLLLNGQPLYTTPPQRPWVGLTDEDLIELSESGLYLWELWRAIEAKLKEKNT